MRCIKLFDFPDGDLLVQRRNGWSPEDGDFWCIDTTIQLSVNQLKEVRESYATEQERDEIFQAINHWTAFPRFRDMRRDLLNPAA